MLEDKVQEIDQKVEQRKKWKIEKIKEKLRIQSRSSNIQNQSAKKRLEKKRGKKIIKVGIQHFPELKVKSPNSKGPQWPK